MNSTSHNFLNIHLSSDQLTKRKSERERENKREQERLADRQTERQRGREEERERERERENRERLSKMDGFHETIDRFKLVGRRVPVRDIGFSW